VIYYYQCEQTGEALEIEAPMADAPEWRFERDGQTFVRELLVQATRKSRRKIARDPYGERIGNKSLPRHWPFAEKHDAVGRPVFDTKGEQQEAHARAAAAGELLSPRELSQPGEPTGMRIDE